MSEPTRASVRRANRRKANKAALAILLTICAIAVVAASIIYILRHWGLEAVLIVVIAGTGAGWGWVIRWLYKKDRMTVSHILTIWMVWTGTILGGASYYLAYRGLSADLETLSRYVMVEVVAGVGGYFVKSGIENVKGKKVTTTTVTDL